MKCPAIDIQIILCDIAPVISCKIKQSTNWHIGVFCTLLLIKIQHLTHQKGYVILNSHKDNILHSIYCQLGRIFVVRAMNRIIEFQKLFLFPESDSKQAVFIFLINKGSFPNLLIQFFILYHIGYLHYNIFCLKLQLVYSKILENIRNVRAPDLILRTTEPLISSKHMISHNYVTCKIKLHINGGCCKTQLLYKI